MNPYLERDTVWHDFHERVIPAIADAIGDQLSPNQVARIDDHIYVTAPAEVRLPAVDEERLSFVEIRDRESWRVITVVELLSPANKYKGPNREQYLAKRGQVLNSRTHLVELDLLRGGPRMPLIGLQACDYYALVSRAEKRPKADIWAFGLRDPIQPIPIPLNAEQPDARIDFKLLLDRIYDSARYANYIYRGRPEPLLPQAEAAWALQFVPAS